jgi:anti-sigma regulatory factor (Ser/Thr protein kinase)
VRACLRYGQSDDGHAVNVEVFSVEADVPGGPHAAARARRLVESELAGRMPQHKLADVCLLVTELVANVVRHGGGAVGRSLHMHLQGSGPGLLVEVMNADHVGGRVAQRRPDMAGGGGIGLHLVERLATRWGVRDDAPTTVWFEFDC